MGIDFEIAFVFRKRGCRRRGCCRCWDCRIVTGILSMMDSVVDDEDDVDDAMEGSAAESESDNVETCRGLTRHDDDVRVVDGIKRAGL
mmetsp:Transcript_23283/g.50327  ORF Transcript_23283/g.50327 Transcript_23283/m.50327 type:complete len:88 (+) Transcript_23283:482-745(+)